MFIAALFTIVKTWKQPKCPSTDEWIKMWCVRACVRACVCVCVCVCVVKYYSAIKENKIVPFAATWMDLEIIMRSKSERKRQISCDITYVESKI